MTTRYSDGTFDLRKAAYHMNIPVLPANTKPDMIWVDIETTGLQFSHDLILEIGMIGTSRTGEVIDGMMEHSYPEVANIEHVKESIDPFVKKMHEDSGLWDDLIAAGHEGYDDANPGAVFVDWWLNNDFEKNFYPMCGSSVHFDRQFLAANFPDIESLFHYRNIDISTLKGIAAMVAPSVASDISWPQEKKHRVIPDILDSISEYRHYLEHMILTDEEKAHV